MAEFSAREYHAEHSDSHTSVHYKEESGYFQRVGQSFCAIGVGFLLVTLSFPLLFWNEGRAVQTAKSLDEGLSIVNSLDSSVHGQPIQTHNEKLVHLSGHLKTNSPLSDPEFGVSVYATHLKRSVEMYQWVETKHKREFKEGSRTRVETTYSYNSEWKSNIVSSSSFHSSSTKYRNPTAFPLSPSTKSADPVHVRSFSLSPGLKSAIQNFKVFTPKDKREGWTLIDNYFYRSVDPLRPVVGDIRVSFTYAGFTSKSESDDMGEADTVSIIARQNGNHLTSFKTSSGVALELLYMGQLTAEEIFNAEHTANSYLTWALRFVGWFLMFIGFQMVMDIFRQIVSFIPLVRDIVGLATNVLAITFASSLSLLVISLGWFWYRPVLSIVILISALVPFAVSRQKAQNEKTKECKE